MGSMNQIIGMLPNMNRKMLQSIDIDENQFIFAPYGWIWVSEPNVNVKKQILRSKIANLSPFGGTRYCVILIAFSY